MESGTRGKSVRITLNIFAVQYKDFITKIVPDLHGFTYHGIFDSQKSVLSRDSLSDTLAPPKTLAAQKTSHLSDLKITWTGLDI